MEESQTNSKFHSVATRRPYSVTAAVPTASYDFRSQERFRGLVQRNDELEKNLREKTGVVEILKRSLQAVRKAFTESTNEELDRGRHFLGEQTTVRRVYLRQLAHTHEHMDK